MIPERVQSDETEAMVYMEDVYSGPGLEVVPRGAVKQLRLFTYHFGYQRLAGIDHRVGADGPWEAKRVLGTVPVEADGSAFFRIPAKTPISVQPLAADGSALALMRSWLTAMPGEKLSCVGCHDHPNNAPLGTSRRIALASPPRTITPWHGPPRGFSFAREVQPVLDRYCVSCHDGAAGTKSAQPDLRETKEVTWSIAPVNSAGRSFAVIGRNSSANSAAVFDPSYVALRAFVRVGGLESDLHLLPPGEFAADTSELVRMLVKGHHHVKLDAEAWDRIFTWIDLNAPCHGTWGEDNQDPRQPDQAASGTAGSLWRHPRKRRRGARAPLARCTGGTGSGGIAASVVPALADWPFDAAAAKAMQAARGTITRSVDLGNGVRWNWSAFHPARLSWGIPRARRMNVLRLRSASSSPFWMSKFEVTNEQFARFDPDHESRFEHRSSWWFDEEYIGWPLNQPQQPVVRVSWEESMAFCRWLSDRIGEKVLLPSEAQWEWACRAGTNTPLYYGGTTPTSPPAATWATPACAGWPMKAGGRNRPTWCRRMIGSTMARW